MKESWLPKKSQKGMMLTPQPVLNQEFSACAGLGPESRDCLTLEKWRKDDERGCKREAQVVSEITEGCKKGGYKEPLMRQLGMQLSQSFQKPRTCVQVGPTQPLAQGYWESTCCTKLLQHRDTAILGHWEAIFFPLLL